MRAVVEQLDPELQTLGDDRELAEVPRMAVAQVAGYQGGNTLRPGALMATAKHFGAYGAATGGRDYNTADISERTLQEVYLPPFYAAALYPVWHDSYGGLRINGRAQVIDMQGEAIPGLYAGGESSGGGNQHGLGRALVHGYIAGTHAAKEGTS